MFVSTAHRAALALAATAVAALAAACGTENTTTTAAPATAETTAAVADGAVPAEFAAWIERAPLPCPSSRDITRAFIAAQLADELAAAGKPVDAAAVAAADHAGIGGMDTEPARAYARAVADRM